MENKLSLSKPLPDIEAAQAAKPVQAAPETPPPPATQGPDLRLVIEENAGTFVYKTIDRRTGEVVLQLPREEMLRLREAEAYAAGDVIDAKA